jgi:chitinase
LIDEFSSDNLVIKVILIEFIETFGVDGFDIILKSVEIEIINLIINLYLIYMQLLK